MTSGFSIYLLSTAHDGTHHLASRALEQTTERGINQRGAELEFKLEAGFAGGFTTLSGVAIIAVLGKLSPDVAAEYIALTIGFGLLAYWMGDTVGRRIKQAKR